MIDITHQLNAVQRRVGIRTLEAGEARVDDVWDGCPSLDRLPRWYLPVSGELRLGGRYQLEGNAGGTVERCDPPHGFAATWEFGGEVSWIEVRLTATPEGRTRFELEHIAHVDDERWNEYGPGAVGVGWDLTLVGLAMHLSSGRAVDRAASEAWFATDDGKQFLTSSSDAWYEEDARAGADPAAARAAADRTAASYTAVPEQA
jgi:hypothetical protein